MIELAVFIALVVLVYMFRHVTKTVAIASEESTKVWAEGVIMDAQEDRQEQFKRFQEKYPEADDIVSSDDVMDYLKVK